MFNAMKAAPPCVPSPCMFDTRACASCADIIMRCATSKQVHVCLVPSERDFLLACLDEVHRRCDSLVNGSESARRTKSNLTQRTAAVCSMSCVFIPSLCTLAAGVTYSVRLVHVDDQKQSEVNDIRSHLILL